MWIPDLLGKTKYGTSLYRKLTPSEEDEFRGAAQQDYEVFSEISPVWHPVYDDECRKMNWDARQANRNLYKIIKFTCPDFTDGTVVMKRLSLDRAQKLCRSDSTRKEGEWFYGYDRMTSADIPPSERYAEYLYQWKQAEAQVKHDEQTGKISIDGRGMES